MHSNCVEVIGLLPFYVAKNLTPPEIVKVVNHIAVCPNCRIELRFAIQLYQRVIENTEYTMPDKREKFLLENILCNISALDMNQEENDIQVKVGLQDISNLYILSDSLGEVFQNIKEAYVSRLAQLKPGFNQLLDTLRYYYYKQNDAAI